MNEGQVPKNARLPLIASGAVALLMTLILHLQGRVWWCKSGDWMPYVNQAWNSSHTSQHLFDPYSLTHILHGVLFFWLTGLLFTRHGNGWRFFVAVTAECCWEVLENSAYVIEKYRQNTASLDYFGDSVMNSLGDVAACSLGFWVAARLGWWRSLAFFFVVEVGLMLWIRDGLLLNIIMLVHPLDWVKNWQSGAV